MQNSNVFFSVYYMETSLVRSPDWSMPKGGAEACKEGGNQWRRSFDNKDYSH